MTYHQLEELLFEYNYTTLTTQSWNSETLFKLPHGMCKKIMVEYSKEEYLFETRESSLLTTVDPSIENKLRIKEIPNSRMYFGPIDGNDEYFEYKDYELQVTLHDNSIQDGVHCCNYDKRNTSHGQCVHEKLMDFFLQNYGCLPPWTAQNKVRSSFKKCTLNHVQFRISLFM
jgi:hypothetical protein